MTVRMLLLMVCLLFGYCSAETCDGDGRVRLVGGPNEFEGRVEVCLEGVWARWCQRGARVVRDEARVVCRQLGHDDGGFGILNTTFHGFGTSLVSISNLDCPQGTQSDITECTYDISSMTESCNDMAVTCIDPACIDPQGNLSRKLVSCSTQDLIEVCAPSGIRAGLCCEDFTAETAAVLCREQAGLENVTINASFSIRIADVNHFSILSPYSCDGSEERFSDCRSITRIGRLCRSVRLNCSEFVSGTSVNPCPVSTSDSTTSSDPTTSSDSPTSADSNTVVIALVVVCVVLVLLMAIGTVILVIVCCKRKGRVTLEKSGISNINYDLGPKPQAQDVEQRTVHNDLYTRQDIPSNVTTSLSANHSASPQHVYDYASSSVQQHTLLHSMASNSESGSHAYSKPTTPLSNYDRTANSFDALGSSSLPSSRTNEYSTLNGIHAEPVLDPSQSHSGAAGDGQYSQIDDKHKYSKLSDKNSKGYSQLDMGGSHPSDQQQSTPEEEIVALPYEVPFSPTSDPDEEARSHAYSTMASADAESTGYSKLHVQAGQTNVKITMQQKTAAGLTSFCVTEGTAAGATSEGDGNNQNGTKELVANNAQEQYLDGAGEGDSGDHREVTN